MQITIIMQIRTSSLPCECKMDVCFYAGELSLPVAVCCTQFRNLRGAPVCFSGIFVGSNVNLLPSRATWILSLFPGLESEFLCWSVTGVFFFTVTYSLYMIASLQLTWKAGSLLWFHWEVPCLPSKSSEPLLRTRWLLWIPPGKKVNQSSGLFYCTALWYRQTG